MSELVRLSRLLVVTLFFTFPVFGHEFHSEEATSAQVNAVVEGIHGDLEARDPSRADTVLAEIAGKFNFAAFVRQALRSYYVHRHQSEHHAVNFAFMLGASHLTETLSGPAYLLYGVINGHPIEILLPTASGLMSQMLPGIDFLCIVLAGTYVGSKDFQDVITSARIYTAKGLGQFAKFSGLRDFYQLLVRQQPGLASLHRLRRGEDSIESRRVDRHLRSQGIAVPMKKRPVRYRIDTYPELDYTRVRLYDAEGHEWAKLEGKEAADGSFIVRRLHLNHQGLLAISDQELKQIWGPALGWNVRDVLYKTRTILRKHQHAVNAEEKNSPLAKPTLTSALVELPYVSGLTLQEGRTWRIVPKPCTHHHCGHEHHHHHHEPLPVAPLGSQKLEAFPEASTLDFVAPAVKIGRFRTFRSAGVVARGSHAIVKRTLLRTGHLIVTSPIWLTKALIHTPGVIFRTAFQTPAAIRKTAVIGAQVTVSSARGLRSLGRSVGKGLSRCLGSLGTLGAR